MKFILPLMFFLIVGLIVPGLHAQDLSVDQKKIENLPDKPFLPDLLSVENGESGKKINTKAQWEEKRDWIKSQYQYWVSGSIPPAPDTFTAEILSERTENGVVIRMVEILFGPA